MKEIGLPRLCLFINLFIDQKGNLPSTTRHEYFTPDLALLPYTETKGMLIVRTVTEGSLKGKDLVPNLSHVHTAIIKKKEISQKKADV